MGGEDAGTPHGVVLGLGRDPADGGQGVVGPALRQPQQCEPRLGRVSSPVGLTVRLLGTAEGAAQAQQFGALVVGRARGGVAGGLRVGAGLLRLGQGVGPLAVQLHDLGAVDAALPAVRLEAGLGGAPAAEGAGPLGGAVDVEGVPARDDHGAVDDAGRDRGDLTCGDGDHRLVEQRPAADHLASGDERLPLTEAAEGGEVGVAEQLGDPGGLGEHGARPLVVAGPHRPETGGHQQVAALHVVPARLVQDAGAAAEPARGTLVVPAAGEGEAQPEGAACGGADLARLSQGEVGPLPVLHGPVVPAGQVGGAGEKVKVGCREWFARVGGLEAVVRLGPGAAAERVPALVQGTGGRVGVRCRDPVCRPTLCHGSSALSAGRGSRHGAGRGFREVFAGRFGRVRIFLRCACSAL